MQAGNWKMKLQLTTRGGKGFALTELLVVICVIAVLVAVLLPALQHHHDGRQPINCIDNLKQIGLAFRIWEGDNGDNYPMKISVTNGGAMELAVAGNVSAIFRVMSNELSTPKVLVCPQDTARHYANNFTTDFNNQKISYFVGLDAEDKYPQMIIAGDDNLAINGVRARSGILNLVTNASVGWTKERIGKFHGLGNIGLSDGSVQTVDLNLQPLLVNRSEEHTSE